MCIAQIDVQSGQSAERFDQQTADSYQLAVDQTGFLPAGQCLVRRLLGGCGAGCLPDLQGSHLLD
jgi:hypothetical protein